MGMEEEAEAMARSSAEGVRYAGGGWEGEGPKDLWRESVERVKKMPRSSEDRTRWDGRQVWC